MLSPAYCAVMAFEPIGSVLVVAVATLPLMIVGDGARVPVPRAVMPLVKVTVPVGAVAGGGGPLAGGPPTCAVSVTACPNVEGFGSCVVRAVLVPTLFTVCVTCAEVLVVKFVSPLYVAVIFRIPTGKVLTLIVAIPLMFTIAGIPRVTGFIASVTSVNVTVPVGVPAPGAVIVTVAESITACPETEGLGMVVRAVLVVA